VSNGGWALLCFAAGLLFIRPLWWLANALMPDHDNIPGEPWMEEINDELEDLADARLDCDEEGPACEGFVALYEIEGRRVPLCEYHAFTRGVEDPRLEDG
jgi:hypothetical protein